MWQGPDRRPQERRQHLVKQEEGEHILDGDKIPLSQRQQRFVRTEEGQQRSFKNSSPSHASTASSTEPITAAVKYWFSPPSPQVLLPRQALKMTLPQQMLLF